MSGPNRYCSARRPDLDGDTSRCDDEGSIVLFRRDHLGRGIAIVRCWACAPPFDLVLSRNKRAKLPKGVRT